MHPDLKVAQKLYDTLMSKTGAPEEISSADTLNKLSRKPDEEKNSLDGNRTAKLCLQYLDMTRLLRMLIKAERLGNWALHLKAVSQSLPYLAVSVHNLYVKSARVYMYLQSMVQLETEHLDIYQNFQSGYHVVKTKYAYVGRTINIPYDRASSDAKFEN